LLFLGDEFSSKWLELLKEALPNVSRVAFLWNPVNPASSHYVTVLQGAAEKLGVMLHLQPVSDPDQFDDAFATMVAARAQALVVVVDPLTVRYRERVVGLAMRNRLPAMYRFREFVDAGGLIAYGVNVPICVGVPLSTWTRSSRVPRRPNCPSSSRLASS
jgi:putative tryptophan/tyrosine transport system substrate-binding protein